VLNNIVLEVNDMDKVIIYGTYHFLGFNLCEKLLEEGIQVCGFQLNETNHEDFLEEKKLLIGRNANFEEKIVGGEDKYLVEETLNSEIIIVISFYDVYYSSDANPLPTYKKIITNIMQQYSQSTCLKVLCLFPIDYIHDFPEILMEQINLLKGQNIPVQMIYLPTIFGPWQPSVFLFQQYLLKEYQNTEPKLDKRESTLDAIYINDLMKTILQLMCSNELNDVLIQSSTSEQWEKGATHLELKHMDFKKQKQIEGNIKIMKVKESISIGEGLEQQKRHLSRLF
jgi:hypothetical protein